MSDTARRPDQGPGRPAARTASRREWIAFTVLLLPLLLVSMDVSVLYFAVPFINQDLAPTATQQLWIFDIYGFVLAGLLLTMGSIGDRIGRRRLLLLGAAAFGLASVAAAYAGSAQALIGVRALLGIGGATLMPSTLALVRHLFPDERRRSTAVAIWTGAMAGGIAVGPVLSGLLLQHFWWGSVFLVNTPAMLLLLVLAPLLVPESRDPAPGRFDLPGALLSLGTVLPLIYGLKRGAADGFGTLPVLAMALGLAVGAAFLVRLRTAASPLIDLRLFRDRGFSGAMTVNTLVMFGVIGFVLFSTQYLQSVLGLSPLTAALWCLAPSVLIGASAAGAAALARRLSRVRVISGGFLVAAAGFGGLTLIGPHSPLWLALAGVTVTNLGGVSAMSLVADLALGTVPPERAGSAAALLETGQEFGGALGTAVLGTAGVALYHARMSDSLPAGTPDAARETLSGALHVSARLPGPTGEFVAQLARTAFTSGLHLAALAAAAVMVVGAAVTPLLLRGVRAPADRPADRAALSGAS
ncbi:MFS transporter [Kitasatospora sp. NPDC057015]|uniref:MFS transporter n=1 Tax=Kitasatospora sp. NPDC057015 TaxID=3346001 RepID=UPI003643E560